MCTVTWLHSRGGYQLLCNRDEKRTRAAAYPPARHIRNGVSYLAPVDAEAGGSWIGVNEYGVSVCLLNGPGIPSPPGSISRGLLLPQLLTEPSLKQVIQRVAIADLSVFAPFTLAVLQHGLPATVVDWNGHSISVQPHGEERLPLVSSSFDLEGVQTHRRRQFHRAAGLLQFHRNHGDHPNAYSPCMHRADAETVSFSWVLVTASEARFHYRPGALCRRSTGSTLRLPRAK